MPTVKRSNLDSAKLHAVEVTIPDEEYEARFIDKCGKVKTRTLNIALGKLGIDSNEGYIHSRIGDIAAQIFTQVKRGHVKADDGD
jgi:hypothetical protein